MKPIDIADVQAYLDTFENKPVYIHLETTNGAYAHHVDEKAVNAGAFIRNAKVVFTRGKITGDNGTFRVGLKLDSGWIYTEGLTDWTVTDAGELLLAGHDQEGRLFVALQISERPFRYE